MVEHQRIYTIFTNKNFQTLLYGGLDGVIIMTNVESALVNPLFFYSGRAIVFLSC